MKEAKGTLSLDGDKDEDVYLDEEDRPGTQALQEVEKKAVSKFSQEEYSSSIFKRIRKEIRGRRIFRTMDSQYVEASKPDLVNIFRNRYEYECKMVGECFDGEKASIMGESSATDEVLSKDKSSEGALRQGKRCDSTKSETEGSNATLTCISGKRRPVPGYLYWILLRQIISNRLARWNWYQRTSHDLCRRVATNSIVVRMQPYGMIIKEACGKDPESGEDIFDRLAAAIEVKVFGRRWPFIMLIGGLCAIGVFSIIYALGQKLLLGLL